MTIVFLLYFGTILTRTVGIVSSRTIIVTSVVWELLKSRFYTMLQAYFYIMGLHKKSKLFCRNVSHLLIILYIFKPCYYYI